MRHYECQRCHEGLELPVLPPAKRCVGCHQDIRSGRFEASIEALARWNTHLVSLPGAPSLAGIAKKRSVEWLTDYLLNPRDLRPGLRATMPRLVLTRAQAGQIAHALARKSGQGDAAKIATSPAAVARGKALFETKACATCHDSGQTVLATQLAPSLSGLNRRFRPEFLVQWLLDPEAMTPGTLMPASGLSRAQAQDLAAYLWHQDGEPVVPKTFIRLPLLKRKVRFKEVSDRVFRKLCWHCHSQPDFARGDGGPGNTGGMGFEGRGLDPMPIT